VLAAVAVGCGSGQMIPDTDIAGSSQSVEAIVLQLDANSPLNQLLGPTSGLGAEAEQERQRVERDLLVQACMKTSGFEYFPSPPPPEAPAAYYRGLEPGTLEWAQRYGLGITTLWFEQDVLTDLVGAEYLPSPDSVGVEVDGNVTFRDSLSAAEADAYDVALNAVAGCLNHANKTVEESTPNQFTLDFQDELLDLNAEIDSDPRIFEAEVAAARCLADSGVRFRDTNEATRYLTDQLRRPEFNGRLQGSAREPFAQLQEEEVAFATALFGCGASPLDTYRLRAEIRDEHESKFIAANESELREYGLS